MNITTLDIKYATKPKLKPFFLLDNTDDTILNIKLKNYIEKIRKNHFYGGIFETDIISNYYDLNISVYISGITF